MGELIIRLKEAGPTLSVQMNVKQFEIFIKLLPNLEKTYQSLVKSLLLNTGMGEKETKVLVASQILDSINRAMPKGEKDEIY